MPIFALAGFGNVPESATTSDSAYAYLEATYQGYLSSGVNPPEALLAVMAEVMEQYGDAGPPPYVQAALEAWAQAHQGEGKTQASPPSSSSNAHGKASYGPMSPLLAAMAKPTLMAAAPAAHTSPLMTSFARAALPVGYHVVAPVAGQALARRVATMRPATLCAPGSPACGGKAYVPSNEAAVIAPAPDEGFLNSWWMLGLLGVAAVGAVYWWSTSEHGEA